MQRLNRSTHAPAGTVFFLVLGLAILPVSLRAAGVQVSFSPRLSAAMDAWQQMAEVFGVNYGPGTATDLSVVKDSDSDAATPTDDGVDLRSEFACAREDAREDLSAKPDLCEARALKAAPVRRGSSKQTPRYSPASKRAALAVGFSFEGRERPIGTPDAMKIEMIAREGLLKSLGLQVFRKNLEEKVELRDRQLSKNLRLLVRVRRGVAPSATKTAECKVFAALASARRLECQRAMLTSTSSTSLDNSEF